MIKRLIKDLKYENKGINIIESMMTGNVIDKRKDDSKEYDQRLWKKDLEVTYNL